MKFLTFCFCIWHIRNVLYNNKICTICNIIIKQLYIFTCTYISVRNTKFAITNNIFILGKAIHRQLEKKELDLLESKLNSSDCYSIHPQLYIITKNRVITACSASRAIKRINYCVIYEVEVADASGISVKHAYGLLQRIVLSNSESYSIILPLNETTTRLFNNPVASSKFHEHYMAFSPPRFDLTYLLYTYTYLHMCI